MKIQYKALSLLNLISITQIVKRRLVITCYRTEKSSCS